MSKLKVKKEKCDQCLYTENRIVSKVRAAEIIQETIRNDCNFECHKGTIAGEDIICRGSFDKHPGQLVRIIGRMGGIEFVD